MRAGSGRAPPDPENMMHMIAIGAEDAQGSTRKAMTRRAAGDCEARRNVRPKRSGRGVARLSVMLAALGIFGALFLAPTADAHGVTTLIVPGEAIGSVKLGEREASVQTTAGPGKKFESPHDLIFYKRPSLLVGYVGGRVVSVEDSDTIYGTGPIVDAYYLPIGRFSLGLGDSFNQFAHASFFHHRHCKSGAYMGGADGKVPYTATRCIVIAPNGNFTAFGFAGPDTAIPDCLGITVAEKSQLAAAESAPVV